MELGSVTLKINNQHTPPTWAAFISLNCFLGPVDDYVTTNSPVTKSQSVTVTSAGQTGTGIHTGLGSSSLITVGTCPPLSSSPHANSFVIGPGVIKHTHPVSLMVGSCTSHPGVRFPNERNQGKQAHPVSKYRVPHGSQPRHGWAPDPPMVGIRSPICLVVGSCTSHPGVLGSIPKREEPGKTGAPCVKVPGSSRVPSSKHTQ